MNNEIIIKSLNFTEGEVLTLEKAQDRMEFEALPIMNIGVNKCFVDVCDEDDCKCNQGNYEQPCTSFCSPDTCNVDVPVIPCFSDTCDCVGPQGYFNCRPYKG